MGEYDIFTGSGPCMLDAAQNLAANIRTFHERHPQVDMHPAGGPVIMREADVVFAVQAFMVQWDGDKH